MSTELTLKQKALGIGLVLLFLAVLASAGLLLREYAPGNMGNGFLVGAGVAVIAAAVAGWRVLQRPDRATTLERGWTQTGDERDDAILTRALAVLGLAAFPATGVAAIIIALGASAAVVLALLFFAQIGIFAVAFTVSNRRG